MEFVTIVEWNGSYPAKLTCQNGAVLDYSPPEEFGGPRGPMTPEDAFISSANMCFQIVFAGIAKNLRIDLLSIRCRAVGDLDTVNGSRKFVGIDIFPEITVASEVDPDRISRAVEATKRKCLVTNSMDLEVRVHPEVVTGGSER